MLEPRHTEAVLALPAPLAEPFTFADWLYARCGAVRHYRQSPVIQDGERAAWAFWCGKQAERMQAGGK